MVRALSLVFVVFVSLLSGCGGGGTTTATMSPVPTSVQEPESEPAPVVEPKPIAMVVSRETTGSPDGEVREGGWLRLTKDGITWSVYVGDQEEYEKGKALIEERILSLPPPPPFPAHLWAGKD